MCFAVSCSMSSTMSGSSEALEPCRHIRGLADDRTFPDIPLIDEIPDDHDPGGDAHPDTQRLARPEQGNGIDER